MTGPASRLAGRIGDLGARWGLPADAARVHALLYLRARPLTVGTLAAETRLDAEAIAQALAWLGDYGLVHTTPPAAWATADDPWALMVRALDARRARELGPMITDLRDARREALADGDRTLARQTARLIALADDLTALGDAARRLPTAGLRNLVALGSRLARPFAR